MPVLACNRSSCGSCGGCSPQPVRWTLRQHLSEAWPLHRVLQHARKPVCSKQTWFRSMLLVMMHCTAVAHLSHASLDVMAHVNCSSAQCTFRMHGHNTKSALGHPGPVLRCTVRHASCAGSSDIERVIPHHQSIGSSVAQFPVQPAQLVSARHPRATREQVKVVLPQQA